LGWDRLAQSTPKKFCRHILEFAAFMHGAEFDFLDEFRREVERSFHEGSLLVFWVAVKWQDFVRCRCNCSSARRQRSLRDSWLGEVILDGGGLSQRFFRRLLVRFGFFGEVGEPLD